MKRMTISVELVNGDAWDVQTTTRDYVAYETTAKKQRPPWGSMSDNLAMWEAFVAWHASKRIGKFVGSWEQWLDECVSVDGRADESVDPTRSGLGGDSSLT